MPSQYANISIRSFAIFPMRTLFIVIFSLQVFSACGLKAPLYLPQEPSQPQKQQEQQEQPERRDQPNQPDQSLN